MNKHKISRMRFFLAGLLVCVVAFSACKKNDNHALENPEQKLLDIFTSELELLKSYENGSYLDYVLIQVNDFSRKQRRLTPLIEAINEKFSEMKEHEQIDYQEQWRRKFQPVVDSISEHTKKIISTQTADLTPDKMAQLERLSIRQQNLEKEKPAPKLLPVFFDNLE